MVADNSRLFRLRGAAADLHSIAMKLPSPFASARLPAVVALAVLAACGDQGTRQPAAVPAATPAPASAPAAASPASAPAQAPAAPVQDAAVAASVTPPAASAVVDELPPIRIDPPTLDFGVMAPRAGGKGSVTLTNTGSVPLRIVAVTPSCKCTTTSMLAGKVLAPGASEKLDAALDGAAMPQVHRATVKIAVEGYARVAELQLRGETSMPLRCVPGIINAVEGKPRAGRFLVESIDRQPFTICAVGGRAPEFIGFTPGDAPRPQYLLKYDLDTWGGQFPAYMAIETDRADCPVFDIWVRTAGTIPRPVFKMKDYRVNAGRIDVGGSREVVLEMEDPGEDMLAIQPESDAVQLELIGQEVRDGVRSVRVRVTPRSPATGLLYSRLTLFAREREQPLTLFATVRAPGATGCVGCNPVSGPPAADGPGGGDAMRDLSAPAGR